MSDLRTLVQFQGSEMSPGLFQEFMHGSIKYCLFSVTAESIVVVVTVGYQFRGQQFNSHGWSILDSRLIKFMFSSCLLMKFVILVEDSDSAYCFG